MSRFLLFILSISAMGTVFAAAPNPDQYLYEARLNTGPMQTQQVVRGTLSEDILRHTDSDFGNLQLLDELNAQPEFILYDVPAGPLRKINTLNVSSASLKTSPENLLDDNRLTEFAFDQTIDAENPAVITVDFGRLVNLHRIELWPTFQADIKGMELKYGLKKDEYKTLRRKGAYQPIVDSDFPAMKWLQISLWGGKVQLEDLNFFERERAEVYFTAEAERRYRVVYGGEIDNKRYAERVSEPQRSDQAFGFTKPEFNKLASDDFDGDGVLNQDDNCPNTSNKNQADDDGDGWGDKCDNAKEVKNFAQSDVDLDGIGDLIDNCKLQPNPKQKDKDNDGFGDTCDGAYAKESVFNTITNPNQVAGAPFPYGLMGGLLALLAVLGVGVFVGTKKR